MSNSYLCTCMQILISQTASFHENNKYKEFEKIDISDTLMNNSVSCHVYTAFSSTRKLICYVLTKLLFHKNSINYC